MKLLIKLLNKLSQAIYKLSLKSYEWEKKAVQKRIKGLTQLSYKLRETIMKIEKEKTELENQYK